MNHRVQMCSHRASIFCQLLGSPERNHRSPRLAASTNHPVGGGYLAKLMQGNPWWGEEGWGEEWRRDSWRGRKARTMWERLAPVGKLLYNLDTKGDFGDLRYFTKRQRKQRTRTLAMFCLSFRLSCRANISTFSTIWFFWKFTYYLLTPMTYLTAYYWSA